MVVPLAQPPGFGEPEVPDVIRHRWVYGWWFLVLLWFGLGVGQAVALNPLGALASFMMVSIVYSMISNNCEKMTQHCLLLFGMLNFMGTFLDSIALISLLDGRVSQQVDLDEQKDTGSSKAYTYRVIVEKHPFFDNTQGLSYNMQSAMMIASPIVNFVGCLLCYICYHTYATSMFDEEEQANQMLGGARQFQGAGNGNGNYGGADSQVTPFQGTGQRLGDGRASVQRGSQMAFEGQGQRLNE